MSKVNLTDIGSGFNLETVVNANHDAIETGFNNTLSRDGTSPNQMGVAIDMNSSRILNLGSPVDLQDAARWADVVAGITITGVAVPSQAGNSNKSLSTNGTTLSWQNLPVFYARTAAEIAAGVNPVNFGYDALNVLRYGALGNDSADNIQAFTDALAVAAQMTTLGQATITFPSGIYRVSTFHNWYQKGLTLQAIGKVTIKCTANNGYIFKADAGAASQGYDFRMLGDFYLDTTNLGVGTGILIQNMNHGSEINAKIKNVVSVAGQINGCVLATIRLACSSVFSGAFTTTPINCFVIDGSTANTQTTDCYFDLIAENATGDGVVLTKCGASIFRGTAEGVGGKGVVVGNATFNFDNHFQNFFCEGNTGSDFDISGTGTILTNCTGTSAGNAIKIRTGASRTKFDGGTFHDATLDSGSTGTQFNNTTISTTITDNTVSGRTIKTNIKEAGLSGAIRPTQIYMLEDWTNATYSGTWSNTSGTYQRVQYAKNYSTNEIILRGEAGGGGAGTVITVLPVGYRPSKSFSFICAANAANSFASVIVDTSGNVTHTTGGNLASIDLSSIRFFLG